MMDELIYGGKVGLFAISNPHSAEMKITLTAEADPLYKRSLFYQLTMDLLENYPEDDNGKSNPFYSLQLLPTSEFSYPSSRLSNFSPIRRC